MKHFGSMKRLREASVEEIAAVKGVSETWPGRFTIPFAHKAA